MKKIKVWESARETDLDETVKLLLRGTTPQGDTPTGVWRAMLGWNAFYCALTWLGKSSWGWTPLACGLGLTKTNCWRLGTGVACPGVVTCWINWGLADTLVSPGLNTWACRTVGVTLLAVVVGPCSCCWACTTTHHPLLSQALTLIFSMTTSSNYILPPHYLLTIMYPKTSLPHCTMYITSYHTITTVM